MNYKDSNKKHLNKANAHFHFLQFIFNVNILMHEAMWIKSFLRIKSFKSNVFILK